jgi:hypothetical protein
LAVARLAKNAVIDMAAQINKGRMLLTGDWV